MAEPKKKLSKTRTNRRRAQFKVAEVAVIICTNCGEPTMPHMICKKCGYYKGEAIKKKLPTERIVATEEKEEKK